MSRGFTGIEDVDYQILQHMNSQELINACQTNKTFKNYCNNTILWENKLIDEGYYFITEYPNSTVGWIALFTRLNQARANLNRMLLICKILPSPKIYIQGPRQIIHAIIYDYFNVEADKYIKSTKNNINIDKNLVFFGTKSLIMSTGYINNLLLIAYYYETFNDYTAKKDTEDYLLITGNRGTPFLIGEYTHNYIHGDAYYDNSYNERYIIGKTIDYFQKHYHCLPK